MKHQLLQPSIKSLQDKTFKLNPVFCSDDTCTPITANGIYGLEPRPLLTSASDINASSEIGVNGTVQINTPNVNPSQGLVELSTNLVDVSAQLQTSCNFKSSQRANSFVITGHGGIPPSPTEPLMNDTVLTPWIMLPGIEITQEQNNPAKYSHKIDSVNPTTQIVEAQGWLIDGKGDIVLVASAPTTNPHNPWSTPASCPAFEKKVSLHNRNTN
ncbi:MAG: S-layer family protein [Fischerella sp. CENA71]|nr:S-layer family protein [Fischerella sp. CENA71]